MAKVIVSKILAKKIKKKFKGKAKHVFRFMKRLETNPSMGDFLTQISRIKLKELKYEKVFRLYFFSNEELVKIMDQEELESILIKFVDMSKKGKEQQKIIDRLKNDLRKFGFDFFEGF